MRKTATILILAALAVLFIVVSIAKGVMLWHSGYFSPPPPETASAQPKPGDVKTVDLGGGVIMDLIWCPPGSFMMGSPRNEKDRDDDETQHRVTLTRGFWLGQTEVTQAQWERVMGGNPSGFKGSDRPVESVSWHDCQKFVEELNRQTGERFRLPTEAEWEYACRAGTSTAYCFGDDADDLDAYAWYSGNAGGRTHEAKQKRANAWGLYDMHGNVCEWCADWYGDYPSGSVTDPSGPSSGSNRVKRGGSWYYTARYCRSAFRSRFGPGFSISYLGFRLLAVRR